MSNIGEITGENLHRLEKHDMGMPLRNGYSIRKMDHDPNEFRSFDVHNPVSDMKKLGTINDSHNYSTIENSMDVLSSQLKPENIISNEITKIALINYLSFRNGYSSGQIAINAIGLFTIFTYLYIASDYETEIELKKYFNFPEKKILVSGLSKILMCVN